MNLKNLFGISLLISLVLTAIIPTASFADDRRRRGEERSEHRREYRHDRWEPRHERREWREGRWWPIVEFRPYYRPYGAPVVYINE